MTKIRTLWIPVLLGALLAVALVGVAGARPNARPEASPALQNHMIAANRCIPGTDGINWHTTSAGLMCDASVCGFECPIKPPHEGLIRAQRIAMYAYDNSAGAVCLFLVQTYPKTGSFVNRVVNGCTTNSTDDPQVVTFNPANFKVSQLQDLNVFFTISSTGEKLYGFKLKYEPL